MAGQKPGPADTCVTATTSPANAGWIDAGFRVHEPLRAMPIPGQTTHPARHRYFSRRGRSSFTVLAGQNLRSVMMAFLRAEWQGQVGALGICGMRWARTALACSAFFWRFWMTRSTVTCSSSARPFQLRERIWLRPGWSCRRLPARLCDWRWTRRGC